jgi:hypothetical protein
VHENNEICSFVVSYSLGSHFCAQYQRAKSVRAENMMMKRKQLAHDVKNEKE